MSSYSEGQVHQLVEALERAGFTPDDLTKLGQSKNLSGHLNLLRGQAEVMIKKHLIDLSSSPSIPEGWEVVEHKKGKMFEWDPTKVSLHLSPNQQNGRTIEGHKLRQELAGKPVANANVLDYLLAHRELIPEEWKGKFVFFWGTIYRVSDGDLYVRSLFWSGRQGHGNFSWLGVDWSSGNPSLLLAS